MIQQNSISLNDVSDGLLNYLKLLMYSDTRIKFYHRGITLITDFMKKNEWVEYSSNVCSHYVTSILEGNTYESVSRIKKDFIRVATVLLEYQTTGAVNYRSANKCLALSGEIGNIIEDFLEYRHRRNFSRDTIGANRIYLYRFHIFLETHGIDTISQLSQPTLLKFINSLAFYSKGTIHCTLCSLRMFLRYLNEIEILEKDLSYLVPKDNYKKEAKLPTTYTKDEIKLMLACIDRGNPKGKRDYAMVLLAARLGLRASDICGMKFSNILWDKNIIVLIQQKTKRRIELPLLQEIGNAIIDYLKYGRPSSDLPYFFLKLYPPYERLAEPTLHSIVSAYLKLAGIDNVMDKKHGPHALRHSLAGFLLEQKTPLPVISEVLGHQNTESTRVYLSIDRAALKQCALDVPPINKSFYEAEVPVC